MPVFVDEQALYIRKFALEMSMWRNKHYSMQRLLDDAESFEHWLLRDKKADLHVITKNKDIL